MPRGAFLAALLLLAVPLAGCLGDDQAPGPPEPDEPSRNQTGPATPGTFTYDCPPGPTSSSNGVCRRAIADPTTSLQGPDVAVRPGDASTVAIAATAVPTAGALDPQRPNPGVDRERAVLLASTDGGETWTRRAFPYVPEDDAGPADVARTRQPRLAWSSEAPLQVSALATQKDPARGLELAHASTGDLGDTWSGPQVLTGDDDNAARWLTRGPEGTLYRPWTNLGPNPSVELARSPGGDNWTGLAEGGAASGCNTTSPVVVHEGRPHLACTLAPDGSPTAVGIHALDRANRSLRRTAELDGIPARSPHLVALDGGPLAVLADVDGELRASLREPGGDWGPPRDLSRLLAVDEGWSSLDLQGVRQGPRGAVHLLLDGRENRSQEQAPPIRHVAHVALSGDLDRVLAQRVLWSSDGEPEPPATLAPGTEAPAIDLAFANGTGILAWGQDGAIGLTLLDPVLPDEPFPLAIDGAERSDCPTGDQRVYCFRQARGRVAALAPGQPVNLTFRNVGQDPHNLFVTTANRSDPARESTPSEAAFARTETIAGGETTNLTFTVPEDADELYLWCNLGRHEARGMWLQANLTGPESEDRTGNASAGNATGPSRAGPPAGPRLGPT